MTFIMFVKFFNSISRCVIMSIGQTEDGQSTGRLVDIYVNFKIISALTPSLITVTNQTTHRPRYTMVHDIRNMSSGLDPTNILWRWMLTRSL